MALSTIGKELLKADRILLDASDVGTDVGDEFLLDGTDASATNAGSKIIFEEATDDGAAALNNRLNQKFDVESLPQGSIVQVQTVKHNSSVFTTTSTSYVGVTTLLGHIKPKFADSKILIIANLPCKVTTYTRYMFLSLRRSIAGAASTDLSGTTLQSAGANDEDGMVRVYASGTSVDDEEVTLMAVDNPGTTEELAYFPSVRRGTDSATITIGDANLVQTITLMEIRDQESSALNKVT